tara:strand:+ start:602 stop:1282 length:681 start_codon:yes stop_codon:yes gene_type:complete
MTFDSGTNSLEQSEIENKIQKACKISYRERSSVELIAVSKRQPNERVKVALDHGFRNFGENQIQEAHKRWNSFKPIYPDLRLHLIGALQSNKVADAVNLFDFIHTIDRDKIAKTVSLEMKKQNKNLPCFIQVNTGREPQKSGINPREAVEFARVCSHDYGLMIKGFMCIPPIEEDASPHFAFLNKLASKASLKSLSMGMSSDFEDAIRLGATHIRIGAAFFGERTY